MSRRQGITAGVVLFVLASCAPAASSGSTTPPSPAATASSSASPPNTASPTLDRLTIAAMRARAYPASSFTLVRTDGDQGGYVNTVVRRNAAIAAHGTPMTDPTFWDSVSAIDDVGFTTAAVQVNQDVGDTVVPKLFADHLVAALRAAGRSVQYNTYPGDDHQFTQNRAAILANAVAFYNANLQSLP